MPNGEADRKHHVFQVKQSGNQMSDWYAPDRDILFMFPNIVRSMWEVFDDGEYMKWAESQGITQDQVSDAVMAMSKLVAISSEVGNLEELMEQSGFAELPLAVRMVVLACIGNEAMKMFQWRICELNFGSQIKTTNPLECRKAADLFEGKYGTGK